MTSLEDLRHQVRELKETQGFEATPEERLAYVVTELGEVSEALLELGEISEKTPEEDLEEARSRLEMEIYDVFWNLCDPAVLTGMDLEEDSERKAELNGHRR